MKRLLIVDDDELDRKLIVSALKRADPSIRIHEAQSGQETHIKLKELWPILTLLDIRMPGMDGFEVLEGIRSDEHYAELQVLMLSGSDDPEDMRRARELGANDYCVKPHTREGYQALADDICTRWLSETTKH
ncbi:MAG: response regulator [Pseudomonadota bacterium]